MMTRAQFEGEKNYRISVFISRKMRAKGLISDDEYHQLDGMLKEKYSPIIGSL